MKEETTIVIQNFFLNLQIEESNALNSGDEVGYKIALAKQEAMQKTLEIIGVKIEGVNSKFDEAINAIEKVKKQKEKPKFSFNYKKACPICEQSTINTDYNIYSCPQGCCSYELDDVICATLFNGKIYFLPWNEYEKEHDLEKFIEEIAYWKEKNEAEGWELEKSFPKLKESIKNYKAHNGDLGEWDHIETIFKMDKTNRMRYVSRLLCNIDLPYTFNYGGDVLIKEFLDAVLSKEEVNTLKSDLELLSDIINEYQSMAKEEQRANRDHPFMKKAEKWGDMFSNKANQLLEIVENMSDEELLS